MVQGWHAAKVGLDRLLIPTAVVANLFRSARDFKRGAAGRGLGDRRSQRAGGSGDHCPNSLYKTNSSQVLDERVVEKTGVQGAINACSGGAIQVLASRKRGWPLRLSRRSPLPN